MIYTIFTGLILQTATEAAAPPEKCGVTRVSGLNRIIGGGAVSGVTYPWYVALAKTSNGGLSVACGATLIAPRYLLTAAHCYAEYPKAKWTKLYSLIYNLNDRCNPGNVTLREPQPSKVEIHRLYRSSKLAYDIALITLPTKAATTPICLPPLNLKPAEGVIMGFGSALPRAISSYPCKLQQAKVPVLSKRQCVRTGIGPTVKSLNGVFCAGKTQGGVDSCDGDSGGPLQVQVDGRYAIKGIVSFGYGCARKNMPGVYTDVSSYLDWIQNRIQKRNKNRNQG